MTYMCLSVIAIIGVYFLYSREIRLEETLERCKQVLHLLEKPEIDSLLVQVHPGTMKNAEARLRDMYRQLADDRRELEVLWTAAENRINITHKVQKYRERAGQVGSVSWTILHSLERCKTKT